MRSRENFKQKCTFTIQRRKPIFYVKDFVKNAVVVLRDKNKKAHRVVLQSCESTDHLGNSLEFFFEVNWPTRKSGNSLSCHSIAFFRGRDILSQHVKQHVYYRRC